MLNRPLNLRAAPVGLALFAALLVALLLASSTLPAYAAPEAPAAPPPPAAQGAVVALTPQQTASLLYMREEEKLAHDVYVTLGAQWGLRAFANIARAEERHTESVATLLERYGLADPTIGNGVGVFADTTLQAIYDETIAMGSESLVAAVRAAALIEETDITDLDLELVGDDALPADMAAVYSHLRAGSANHLRAFVRQIERLGESYTPSVLDDATYEAILLERAGRR